MYKSIHHIHNSERSQEEMFRCWLGLGVGGVIVRYLWGNVKQWRVDFDLMPFCYGSALLMFAVFGTTASLRFFQSFILQCRH